MNFTTDINTRIENALEANPEALAALKAHPRYDDMVAKLEDLSPCMVGNTDEGPRVFYSPLMQPGAVLVVQMAPHGVQVSAFIPDHGYVERCVQTWDDLVRNDRAAAIGALAIGMCPPVNVAGVIMHHFGITSDTLVHLREGSVMPTVLAYSVDGQRAAAHMFAIFETPPSWVLERAA